jgi:glycosyltransferase involved in cell wall biosynthesis
MKICFVINEFNFFLSHRFDLLAELAKNNSVTLITDTSLATKIDLHKCMSNKIELQHLKQRAGLLNASPLRFFFQLRRKLYQASFDHIFFVTIEMSLFGALLKNRRCVAKKYYLITGLGAFFDDQKIKYKVFKNICAIIFKLELNNSYSTFIFQNYNNQNSFINLNLAKKENSIVIKGSGIKQTNKSKVRIIGPRKLIKFCFAGNITISKGLRELLEASENLYLQNYKFELHIAGKYLPNRLDYISTNLFTKLQQSKYITYYGQLNHSSMSNFYSSLDVFILPSYGEGLPKSALEAASHGLPLLLTNVAGCNECISDNGYLIPARNSLALQEKMQKFIENSEMVEAMSKKSISMIRDEFEITKISNKYLQLLKKN